MKCLFITDLHYVLKQFDWVLKVANKYDLIVIGGDHLDISSSVDPRVQIVVVIKYLQRLQAVTQIFVCSGNHDLDARNRAGEKYSKWISKVRRFGIPTDGDSVIFDDTLFTICPWWDGPQGRDQVAAQITKDAQKSKDRWIWVYHSPPANSPTSWSGQRHFGDAELERWIDRFQPDMVLTGHIHNSPFLNRGSWVDQLGSTWVFNPGRQIGPFPCHIIFETDQRLAIWLSIETTEMVQLDKPLELPVTDLVKMPVWFT